MSKVRLCLYCGKEFKSTWAGHRRCSECNKNLAHIASFHRERTPHKVHTPQMPDAYETMQREQLVEV